MGDVMSVPRHPDATDKSCGETVAHRPHAWEYWLGDGLPTKHYWCPGKDVTEPYLMGRAAWGWVHHYRQPGVFEQTCCGRKVVAPPIAITTGYLCKVCHRIAEKGKR